ncbi:Hypothetical predicted protein [Paramuricea clavata]|uniref:Uncharacterized protein n=1 Tax=Paramuricea clavata TaxID=317549 RepID=A0A7D9IGY3_PARCT|nr:Hypothetical predicted protein [Paramuricea clavata]
MASGSIQWAPPKPLHLEGNVSENFRKFEEHWTLFEKTEPKGKSEEEKCSYFLLCIGEKAREVHKTLAFSTPETSTNTEGATVWKRTTQELKTAFKAYCNPRKNLTFERHKLNTRNQDENETIDQYVTALRTLAATCEFESLHDGLIRDRIVCGIKAQTLKERMLRENDLTLQKAIDICPAAETSRDQLKSLCGANPDGSNPHDEKQLKDLELFMEDKKGGNGLLLAWAIVYFDLWEQVFEDANEVVEKVLKGLLQNLKLQPRWMKGVSSMIIALTMLRLSCGKTPGICDYVLFTCQEITESEIAGPSAMQKLEKNIVKKIRKQSDPILTWLHPSVTVHDVAGNKVPGIAIITSVVDAFPDVSNSEFKEEQRKQTQNPVSIGVYFNANGDGTLDDMVKRRGTCQRRAYRIPSSALSSYTRHVIEFACKIRDDQPEENEGGNEDTGMLNLLQEDIEALEDVENMLRVQMEAWASNRDTDGELAEDNQIAEDINYDYSFTEARF